MNLMTHKPEGVYYMKPKVCLLILSVMILLLLVPPASAATKIVTGKCGENLYYEFNEATGDLRIYGTGDMNSYWNRDDSPFRNLNSRYGIATLVIEEGITSIGRNAFGCGSSGVGYFFKCPAVVIPSTVTRIEEGAFGYLPELHTVIIRNGTVSIERDAFICDMFDYYWNGCHSERVVYVPKSVKHFKITSFWNCKVIYEGTKAQWKKLIAANNYSDMFDTIYFSEPIPNNHSIYDFIGTWVADRVYSYKTRKYSNKGARSDTIVIRQDGTVSVNGEDGSWKVVNGEILIDGYYEGLRLNNKNELVLMLDTQYYEKALLFKKVDSISDLSIVELPSGVNSVEPSAFSNTNADIYIIPEGVTELKSESFSNLSQTKYIVMPQSLTAIEENAFSGTNNAVFLCPSSTCHAFSWLKDHGKNVRIELR